MHFPSLFFAATACMRVAYAEFLVLTEPPYPLSMVRLPITKCFATPSGSQAFEVLSRHRFFRLEAVLLTCLADTYRSPRRRSCTLADHLTRLRQGLADRTQSSSWTTSVVLNAGRSFDSYIGGLGSTYQSSHSSIFSDLSTFVAQASNFTIPQAVLDDSTTTTIFGKPDWYDVMPSNVRSWKEQEWTTIQSIASEVIAARQTTRSSTGGAPAMATGMVGLKNAQWAVGAAAAAAVFL